MLPPRPDRRRFLAAAGAAAGLVVTRPTRAAEPALPALLGGDPARTARTQAWPIIGEEDVKSWMEVLRSGVWNRLGGHRAEVFEQTWAERLGVRHALATANGTSALMTALNALGIGPGDEVIVPPYTFVATINAVLMQHALPVFVDTDPETFQIDARKVESAITPNTRCILPAHIGGSPADLDTLLAIGQKHGIPVIEDACQAHLAEWRGRKVGGLGTFGCFSFQASKNLNSGEGGAVVTGDDGLIAECRSFHNNGRGGPDSAGLFVRNGCNLRLTEFQAALLLAQMTRLEDQSRTREANAAALTEQLDEIPGIRPAKMHEGCTRNAYHLYMFRYDPNAFSGLSRATFLKALAAEGVPASGGYSPLTREPFLRNTLESRSYRAIYPAERISAYLDSLDLPVNERLCGEAVWLGQTTLLGRREEMDQIAEAMRKIRAHAGRLSKL